MNAIGANKKSIVHTQSKCGMVKAYRVSKPTARCSARKVAAPNRVILRQQLYPAIAEPVDARVADMYDISRASRDRISALNVDPMPSSSGSTRACAAIQLLVASSERAAARQTPSVSGCA